MRSIILAVLLACASWFQFAQNQSAHALWQIVRDIPDARPSRRILIFGNSRTYYNDMPAMLRRVADSAGSREKYQMVVYALPGASFETLWNDTRTQSLLSESWDDAVVQGESRGQSTPELQRSFMRNGALLLKSAKLRNGAPKLIVNWTWDPIVFENDAAMRTESYWAMQSAHADLARQTGAAPVNVGKVWESLRAQKPRLALTSDGNHPTVAGSYFVALCLYHSLSHSDVLRVTYIPDGMLPEEAATLRQVVHDHAYEL
jgi:hypothetical protein